MELIDRGAYKSREKERLRAAQASPLKMTALWLGLKALLSLLTYVGGDYNLFYIFVLVLTILLSLALDAGFVLYCMAIRRGERAEYAALFDGFSIARKVILLTALQAMFVSLWSILFVIPGVVAFYRYRFALYNLLENPDLTAMEALSMSKRQTFGFKGQLFALDVSYFGWMGLSVLPDLLYRYGIQSQVYNIVGGSLYWSVPDVMKYVNPDVFGMPWGAWQALIILWALAVGVCYLAHYQCVELAYFDAAKRVSTGPAPDDLRDVPRRDKDA